MTETTPLAELTRIVLAGIRNAGKSSLMNNLFGKDISIISATPGTTTDPVTRKIELGKLGMCAVTDTAGLDDEGTLGSQRMEKAVERLDTADLVLFVSPGDKPPAAKELELLGILKERKIPYIGVLTFADRQADDRKKLFFPAEKCISMDNTKTDTQAGTAAGQSPAGSPQLSRLLQKMEAMEKEISREPTPVEGIVQENDLVLLVTPVDLAAPAGRLILPQVETIRDLLDHDCAALIVKERELYSTYTSLGRRPDLVITDSQAFHKVAADIPEDQKLTSFSILFARKKGNPEYFIKSLKALASFPEEGKVLVMEACSHHRQADDLGTVKIPRLFRQLAASRAQFTFTREMPEHPADYDLVIQCAGCMVTQKVMNSKIDIFRDAGVPVINYGLFLAWANGLLPRALEPFPGLADIYTENRI